MIEFDLKNLSIIVPLAILMVLYLYNEKVKIQYKARLQAANNGRIIIMPTNYAPPIQRYTPRMKNPNRILVSFA